MRIGFDAKRATHNFRGLGNYSRSLIEGLNQFSSENQLVLFTPKFKNDRILKWIKDHSKLKIHFPNSVISNIFPAIWRSFFLEKEIHEENIDIYHGLSHEIPILSGNQKFKSIVTIHDLIFMRYPQFFNWIDRKIYYKKFKYAVDNADLVIAICEQTQKDIIHFLNVPQGKIKIHYQSASPLFYEKVSNQKISEFQNRYHIKNNYILHVGAFEENKNQLNVLKSFAKICNEFDINLIFVGQGKKYLDKVKDEIIKLKLESRVRIFSQIPFDELPILYQGASLFCFPSFFEGFGIPIIEALFSEVPVITTQGFCFPESAGPNSLYFDPADTDSIANSIRQVLRSPDLQKIMRSEGLKYAERFKLQNTTKNLIDIYTQLLNK